MKKYLIASALLSLLISLPFQSTAMPYEPQVKGGFKSCTVNEYRSKTGKFNEKAGVKSYSVNLDEKGNKSEVITYENNKIAHKNKVTNKYNEQGLLVETIYFDESGKPNMKFAYGYDGKMNKICDTMYNSSGEAMQSGSYIYDENNFMIQEIHEFSYDKDKKSKGVTNYKNDKYGNKIEESAVHSLNASVQVSSEVNLENNETKTEASASESDAKPDKITYEYKYDEYGNIIRSVRNGIGGTKLIYEFKYDKFGNIIEQVGFDENNKPALKTVFEYTK